MGTISLNQRSDGNYTGVFRASPGVTNGLKQALLDISKKPESLYYIKADDLLSFNYPVSRYVSDKSEQSGRSDLPRQI